MYKVISTPFYVIQQDVSKRLANGEMGSGDVLSFDNEGEEFSSKWIGLIAHLNSIGIDVIFYNTGGICDIVKMSMANIQEEDGKIVFKALD